MTAMAFIYSSRIWMLRLFNLGIPELEIIDEVTLLNHSRLVNLHK